MTNAPTPQPAPQAAHGHAGAIVLRHGAQLVNPWEYEATLEGRILSCETQRNRL